MTWKKEDVYRTTKCFSFRVDNNYNGAFPLGFLKWLREMKWWGKKRCYLCSGMVNDPEAVTVDIKPAIIEYIPFK